MSRRTIVGVACIATAMAIGWSLRPMSDSDDSGSNSSRVDDVERGSSMSDAGIVTIGRIEALEGDVHVSAEMGGTLVSVMVEEGDYVSAGTILAEVSATREEAAVKLAAAQLERIRAGFGAEEIAAAEATRDALAAQVDYAEADLKRATELLQTEHVSDDLFESKQGRAESLRSELASAERTLAAMKRGPLPEEVAVAQASLGSAKANYALREVRASADGVILELFRHTGDWVSSTISTPILRMADTTALQIRVEISELDVYRVQVGMEGEFRPFGYVGTPGSVRVRALIPAFGPRRLFDPDSSARMDTRTLHVLCEITETSVPVYPGQRVTVRLQGPVKEMTYPALE